jgi:hypothetical protein
MRSLTSPCENGLKSNTGQALRHYINCDCFAKLSDRQTTFEILRVPEQRAIGQCDTGALSPGGEA